MNKNSKTWDSLSALALDLKRVSQGLQRGSASMADRFIQEVLKRKSELDTKNLKPYMQKLIKRMEDSLKGNDNQKKAEDCLMYSTLFENAVLKDKGFPGYSVFL